MTAVSLSVLALHQCEEEDEVKMVAVFLIQDSVMM